MVSQSVIRRSWNILSLLVVVWVLCLAGLQLYNIAWGTGIWLGQFAPTWALLFLFFIVFCILFLVGIEAVVWAPQYSA